LVVTFTNAAASEMKQRLLNAIYKKIDENPNDMNLQRQIMLLNHAHICTIHSFCLDVIRNNFYEIGMSANFRVGDTTEIEIMKQEVIEDLFEKKYENQDEEFLKLLDLYTSYKDDTPLKDIILNTYEFINCVPFPEKWLHDNVEKFNVQETDFAKTIWGKLIIEKVKENLDDEILNLESAKKKLEPCLELVDFETLINSDINDIKQIDTESWDKAYSGVQSKEWDPWPRKSKLDENAKELKEIAKAIRDEAKKSYEKEVQKVVNCTSEEAITDLKTMYPVLKSIEKIVLEFGTEFAKRKKEKNIVDFSDIEHLALKLLVNEDGSKTEIAKKYEFEEIAIDEYQDSNLVQESILTSVSNGHNIFMVGDVKQSIYRFRQARPDLFLTKYDKYILTDMSFDELEEDTKIQLYNNFRSRENVLNLTNQVFDRIMSKRLGEINYSEEEYLNFTGTFDEPKTNCKSEMYIIETEKDEDQEESDESEEVIEKTVLEARLCGKKIIELKNQGYSYRDMAILLRSPAQSAPIYEKELIEQGIPVFSDATSEYLESIEIDTILSLLKVIDNPLQDIPLVTVLRSPIGGFTDNELVEVRMADRNAVFYMALEKLAKEEEKKGTIKESAIQKAIHFIETLEEFKQDEKVLPLDELIWKIYAKTGYFHYVRLMPNGKLRQANLKKLFEKAKEYEKISFKGLFNFITFIEKVAAKSSNMQAAKIIGENDDVVRIMSIHKSKGLEFPIVFICNVDKKINLRDLNERLIYDQDVGFGVNFIAEGLEYQTLSKEAIKIKMRKESISEEMRVLYVALTRAKDKLILIGADKNAQDNIEKKQIEISKYHGLDRPEKINSKLVEKYTKYLDWIELVKQYDPDTEIDIHVIYREELAVKEEKAEKEVALNNREYDKQKLKQVDKLLSWKYEFQDAVEAPSKTSVTALKQEQQSKQEYYSNKKQFSEKDKNAKITGAALGTLVHLVLSKIDGNMQLQDVKEIINNLKITEDERAAVNNNIEVFDKYINSNLFNMLKNAKAVYKETPFYMEIPYKNTRENVLVQGVIDLYFVNQDGKIILVDYKTDRNVDENELKERYEYQLQLYKEAIEKSCKQKVYKMIIYSTFLNKEIEL